MIKMKTAYVKAVQKLHQNLHSLTQHENHITLNAAAAQLQVLQSCKASIAAPRLWQCTCHTAVCQTLLQQA